MISSARRSWASARRLLLRSCSTPTLLPFAAQGRPCVQNPAVRSIPADTILPEMWVNLRPCPRDTNRRRCTLLRAVRPSTLGPPGPCPRRTREIVRRQRHLPIELSQSTGIGENDGHELRTVNAPASAVQAGRLGKLLRVVVSLHDLAVDRQRHGVMTVPRQ